MRRALNRKEGREKGGGGLVGSVDRKRERLPMDGWEGILDRGPAQHCCDEESRDNTIQISLGVSSTE